MLIATFNINGINARLPRLLAWLDKFKPDVACLQELKCPDEKFPHAEIEAAGYHALVHGQKSWNGVAILSKQPAVETRRGLPGDDSDEQSRYLEAAVDGILIGALYLPNGNPIPGPKFDYKLAWFERLHAHAASLLASEMPVVLAGDYNVCPTVEDAFSERAMADNALCQPESRAAYRALIGQGWTDAIRAVQPTGKIYTFWDYTMGAWPRDLGLSIDRLLLSPVLADRLLDSGVDREERAAEKASDHAPTWIKLRS
jgi:exodeoxyribonuclease-3